MIYDDEWLVRALPWAQRLLDWHPPAEVIASFVAGGVPNDRATALVGKAQASK